MAGSCLMLLTTSGQKLTLKYVYQNGGDSLLSNRLESKPLHLQRMGERT